VLIAVLVGLSNPLAAYYISPMFTNYVSHDEAPWTNLVSVVLLLAAASCVWPSSRAPSATEPSRTSPEAVGTPPSAGPMSLGPA
jgi:threonine/homoserine/homoserine lactone efflux protein